MEVAKPNLALFLKPANSPAYFFLFCELLSSRQIMFCYQPEKAIFKEFAKSYGISGRQGWKCTDFLSFYQKDQNHLKLRAFDTVALR